MEKQNQMAVKNQKHTQTNNKKKTRRHARIHMHIYLLTGIQKRNEYKKMEKKSTTTIENKSKKQMRKNKNKTRKYLLHILTLSLPDTLVILTKLKNKQANINNAYISIQPSLMCMYVFVHYLLFIQLQCLKNMKSFIAINKFQIKIIEIIDNLAGDV